MPPHTRAPHRCNYREFHGCPNMVAAELFTRNQSSFGLNQDQHFLIPAISFLWNISLSLSLSLSLSVSIYPSLYLCLCLCLCSCHWLCPSLLSYIYVHVCEYVSVPLMCLSLY